eukprot:3618159-Amphidinium_carterae.3
MTEIKKDTNLAPQVVKWALKWLPDGDGVIKQHVEQTPLKVNLSSDLRLSGALHRGSVAYNIAGIMSVEVHNAWNTNPIGAAVTFPEGQHVKIVDHLQYFGAKFTRNLDARMIIRTVLARFLSVYRSLQLLRQSSASIPWQIS